MGKRRRSRSREKEDDDLKKRLKKMEKKMKRQLEKKMKKLTSAGKKREDQGRKNRSTSPLPITLDPTGGKVCEQVEREKSVPSSSPQPNTSEDTEDLTGGKESEQGGREKSVPSSSPQPNTSQDSEDLTGEDNIPDELLEALGKEGENKENVGEELQQHLSNRWTNIIQQGLGKETREQLVKKYPTPANFSSAVPPIMNQEIAAAMNEVSQKRDKRIIFRQMLVGKMMIALGKALSNVLKGNINTKVIVEQLNDSAKLAAEVYHQDSESRKYFALAGATAVVKDAVKKGKSDEYLFGKTCGEQIKAAQTIQKTGSQIKAKDPIRKLARQENWRSPLPPHPQYRSGQPHRPAAKTRPTQQAPRVQTMRKKPISQKPSQSRHHRRY